MTYVNHTIDDKYGDLNSTATTSIDYLREEWWLQGQGETCLGCPIGLPDDPLGTLHSTWRINLNENLEPDPTISITFNGTAIYIYGVIFAYSTTELTFLVDGFPVQQSIILNQGQENPITGPPWKYNQLMYSNTSLNDGLHTVALQNNIGSLVIFDYAVYTTSIDSEIAEPPVPQTETETKTNNNGALIGGVVGGVITFLIILALLVFFWMRKRRIRNDVVPTNITTFTGHHQQQQQQQKEYQPPFTTTTTTTSAPPPPLVHPPMATMETLVSPSTTSGGTSAGTSITTNTHAPPPPRNEKSVVMGWNNNQDEDAIPPAYTN